MKTNSTSSYACWELKTIDTEQAPCVLVTTKLFNFSGLKTVMHRLYWHHHFISVTCVSAKVGSLTPALIWKLRAISKSYKLISPVRKHSFFTFSLDKSRKMYSSYFSQNKDLKASSNSTNWLLSWVRQFFAKYGSLSTGCLTKDSAWKFQLMKVMHNLREKSSYSPSAKVPIRLCTTSKVLPTKASTTSSWSTWQQVT